MTSRSSWSPGTLALVVHCKRDPYDIYIGRPGPWGNGWSHLEVRGTIKVADRATAIALHKRDLWERIASGELTVDQLAALHGKTLGCWCDPQPCHGHTLAAAASWAHWRRGAPYLRPTDPQGGEAQ